MKANRKVPYQESIGPLMKLPARLWQEIRWIPKHFKERDFWIIQTGVILVTGLHAAAELLAPSIFTNTLSAFHSVPVILYILPIIYASIRYGWEGGVMTSLLVTILTVPNMIFRHSADYAWVSDLLRLVIIFGVAATLATRMVAETRLRLLAQASETKFKSLFEAAGDGILVYDRKGVVMAANKAAAGLLGAPNSQSLVGLDMGALLSDYWGNLDTQQPGIMDKHQRMLIRRPDGHKLMADVVVTPLPNSTEEGAFQAILRDVTEQDMREKGLRALVHQVTQAQEDERERIARELHDETLQALFILTREQEEITDSPDVPESLKERLARLAVLTTGTAENLRRFSRDLRPSVLNDLGLIPALEWLTGDLTRRTDTDARFRAKGTPRRLHTHVETALFRIAQESLRNAEKYAHATRVQITLLFETEHVILSIRDNGAGFAVSENFDELVVAGKLGLVGLKERANLFGGNLKVESLPGKGTTVSVDIPE